MPVPEELLPDVLAYCNEEASDETVLRNIHRAWDSALGYLRGAGVKRPPTSREDRHALWLSVACALTLDEYDQRGAQLEGGKLQDNPSFQRKLNQLKLTEPAANVSKLDTRGQERAL
ncbi:MAG: hypothetical protein MR952_06300 [Flavonifractor plautii]|nr:hypothetical protein [Flavonifractor plautii]